MKRYPKPIDMRIGSKVSWYLYDNSNDAEKAAKIARDERAIKLEQGYDFGYQMPGTIQKTTEGWEVTIP